MGRETYSNIKKQNDRAKTKEKKLTQKVTKAGKGAGTACGEYDAGWKAI